MVRAYTVTLHGHPSLLWAFYHGLQLAHQLPSHTIVHAHPAYQFIVGLTNKARVCLSGIPFKCVRYDSVLRNPSLKSSPPSKPQA